MRNIAQKEARKQPKIKTEMNEKGLTVHAGCSGTHFHGEVVMNTRSSMQEIGRRVQPTQKGPEVVSFRDSICDGEAIAQNRKGII